MRLDVDPRLPREGDLPRLVTRLYELFRLVATANNARADGYCFLGASVAASYTMQPGDSVLFVSAAGGARTITLLSPAAAAGKLIAVRKTEGSANNVTLTPPSGLIDGGASLALTAASPRATLISDGTNFYTV